METKPKSKYEFIIHALTAMQDYSDYGTRKNILKKAQEAIIELERNKNPVEVHVTKWMGRSGGFTTEKSARYRISLFNNVTKYVCIVDNNDGWGWPEQMIRKRISHWELLSGNQALWFEEV